MEIHLIVADDRALNPVSDLQSFFVKFSMIRLGIMVFLLFLINTQIFNFSERGICFYYNQDIQYIIFFVLGFSFNIFYILITLKYIASLFVFRIQLVIDYLLSTWWIVLTGGSFSGFLFIYVLILFSYGKILGFRTVQISSFVILLTVFTISTIQFYHPYYWNEQVIHGSDLAYNFSLLTLAFILVNFLVKMNKMEEMRLLHKVIAQEKALQKEEKLRLKISDWIDAGLIIVDMDKKIQMINTKALAWTTNQDQSNILGVSFDKFFPEFLAHWNNKEEENVSRNVVKRNDGIIFGFKMTPLPDDQWWMILFTDITKFQKMEKQIKEMEKMATIGELSSGLAHEMKNPLSGIKTSIQLLTSEDLEKKYFNRLSAVILRDIDRLDALLKDFLYFARPKPASQEYFDLSQKIKNIILPLQIENTAIDITIDISDAPYFFDKNQFHQIFINIILNAFQALENVQDPKIEISEEWEGDVRKIIIADNGPGVSSEIIQKCFDPFVTSKSDGSGLGLSIARRLAIQNNGYLELQNNPTQGARVILTTSGYPSKNSSKN